MKKGWQTKKLADLVEVQNGYAFSSKDYSESGHFLMRIGNVQNGYISTADPKFIKLPADGSLQRFVLSEDDILVSLTGNVGRVGVIQEEHLPAALNQRVARISIRKDSRATRELLLLFLCSDWFREELIGAGHGAAQQNVSTKDLVEIEIPVPPLAEQQRIVGLLDEAFEGLATAKANAEKNLQNARALFESHLQSVFTQRGPTGNERSTERSPAVADDAEMARLHAGYVTRTGGREATTRHIPGPLSLAVGMPSTGARKGWQWSALTDLARLESGHTPSRSHPEYWGGAIPWIGIQDARKHHGERIDGTSQTINELGTANSSARLLPANTVCLSRTASVGYVVVMGRPMATSQDFVNWVCSASLVPDFLKYIFLAESRDGLLRYASGSVHQTIYFPEAKAFHICHPGTKEQLRIIKQCDSFREETQRLARLYERKHAALEALKKSLLHQAFTGAL
jgi:type I restriction enzyme S subunit